MTWQGRTVLVTGSDGFIGSHLVERLIKLGADVRAFCFYNSNGSHGWLDENMELRHQVDFRLGDIRDAGFVEDCCQGVDTIFHLAALIAIPFSYHAPKSFLDTNITGTFNILQAARRNGCRRLIHTSTSEVYGTPEHTPIRETHPLQAQSPYSASKVAADKLCEAYYCSFEVPVTVLRPFNTYGPRQSMRAVLPTILVQLLAGKREIRLGRLDPKRDLTYVSDTVEAFILAADSPGIEGQVIQLGTGKTYSIQQIFDSACRVLGASAKVVQDKARMRPDASEVLLLQSDPTRAGELLQWESQVTLEQGLTLTAQWIQQHMKHYDPNRYHV